MLNRIGVVVGFVLLSLGVGCQPAPTSATPAPTLAAQAGTPDLTPSPAVTVVVPTPEPPSLTLWLPDVLLPDGDDPVAALLTAEVNEFSAQTGVAVEIRRRRADDVGGILATLRSGAVVAPGALPDLTLMRRSDLLAAANEGLIYPLEGRIGSAIIGDLFPSALRLGRAENQLYGLPYLLDIYLTAYRTDLYDGAEWSFEGLLEGEVRFTFPASSSVGLTDVLWLQYLAAGGLMPQPGEPLNLAPSAVLMTLSFYEDMTDAGLISRAVIDFDSPADYLVRLADGRTEAAVITTQNLRALTNATVPLGFATVPTTDADPLTLVDGWMWVMVTPNPEQQLLSGRFLNWMMDSNRQSAYASQIAMPPSQRVSLRRWSFPGMDNDLIAGLLEDSPSVMPEIATSSAARALQSALIDVLSGDSSAAEAAAEALTP